MKSYFYNIFGLMSLLLFLNCGTKTPPTALTSNNSKLTAKQLGETITSDELKEHLLFMHLMNLKVEKLELRVRKKLLII